MDTKQTGYDFWNNVLKSPQFVAAPMVDMSELSFRMLCRHYRAQLCFSPMLHSQQYLQDILYRYDTFSTCTEDNPLIVQLCSNDPNDFVKAASLVSSQCSAIDLNLGCPQAIARKGHYGAFLQDDWDLVRSIVQKASTELPVPVTCKMRILPGDYKNSIQYAKMLVDSGCSVLTVHGRTREQKGHVTGLASWEVIREIKANINIPVIANGNILSFSDVKECLSYTGADAVMSAEALLHNPALFSGRHPPVWSIVQEYLQYAEKYKTSIRCVRCHLFKILYLCIHQNNKIQEILADGKTYADFYAVCDLLRGLPQRDDVFGWKDTEDTYNFMIDSNLFEFPDDNSLKSESTFNTSMVVEYSKFDSVPSDDRIVDNGDMTLLNSATDYNLFAVYSSECKKNESNIDITLLEKLKFKSISSEINDSDVTIRGHDEELCDLNGAERKHLPIWLCHSRPRVVDNEVVTRGCYSKYFNSSIKKIDSPEEEQFLSKKKLRKLRHHEKVVAAKKEKRKTQKKRQKQKRDELRQVHTVAEKVVNVEQSVGRPKMTKKEKKKKIRERLLRAQGSAPKVCINLGFSSQMDSKELSRLSSQLRRLYGSNRHSMLPFHLYFCNFSTYDDLYKICLQKNDGFSSYVVDMTEKSPEEMFQPEDLIYLSPDSDNILISLDPHKIYVIGGIVDGTVKKGLSLNHAKQFNIQTARLPIIEYLVKCSQNIGTTVLTVNQVFDILLKYYETEDWVQSLGNNVPLRKGFCAPSHVDIVSEDLDLKSTIQGDN